MCKWFLLIDLFALELQQWSWDIVTIFVSPRSQNMIRFHMFCSISNSISFHKILFTMGQRPMINWSWDYWWENTVDKEVTMASWWIAITEAYQHLYDTCPVVSTRYSPNTCPVVHVCPVCCACFPWSQVIRLYQPAPLSPPPTHQLLHTLYPSKHVQQQVDHITSQDC